MLLKIQPWLRSLKDYLGQGYNMGSAKPPKNRLEVRAKETLRYPGIKVLSRVVFLQTLPKRIDDPISSRMSFTGQGLYRD